jgi:O-methyltransferase
MALSTYLDLSSPFALGRSALKLWLIVRMRRHSVIPPSKLDLLYRLGRDIEARAIPGAIVECGVFRGGSAAVLAKATSSSRPLYLFDSFQGLPEPDERDGRLANERFHEGWCQADAAHVQRLLKRLRIPSARVHIVPGWFQDTFGSVDVPSVALLHIDADWFDGVRLCLDTFYDRVQPGGFVVLDDYGRWPGCNRAADAFLAERGLSRLLPGSGRHRHYFQKPLEG